MFDHHFMRHAINLARTGQGLTGVNPSVGCVLVKDGRVIAAARTANGGRPHAESIARSQTDQVKGATAYVTLEPCAHEGETPSCARLLVEAGVKRVIIGSHDPDPRTSGKGVALLQAAGIEVITDILKDEAHAVHAGFIKRVRENTPFVTLKTAISLDGKIALGNGESQWITGDLARRYAHVERLKHDAIITGSGTVKADSPAFTVRLGGAEIIKPVYVLSADPALKVKDHFHSVHADHGDLAAVLNDLAAQGMNSILVEGGAGMSTSFLQSGLVDRLLVFRAPKIIGADGVNAFGTLDFQTMDDIYSLKHTQTRHLGVDTLDIYTSCSQD